MNVKQGKALIAGSVVFLIGVTGAGIALTDQTEIEVREVYLPSPRVTETHEVPVPGPTVTKKVTITKTVRPEIPKEVTRSNERKKPKAAAVTSGSARDIARSIFGSQFSCADSLIQKESGWRVNARNPSSGAYGLPQSLPGSKMASAGPDWQTNPATQLRWMKSYVDSRYGGICGAWNHSQRNNWY